MPMTIAQNLTKSEVPENKEDFQLIWFDPNISNEPTTRHIQTMLLKLNPTAQFYTEISLCENFIKTTQDEKLILLISNVYVKDYLVKLAGVRCVHAVFIFCRNESKKDSGFGEHSKVIGIFTDPKKLFSSIKKTMRLLEKQIYAFTLFNQNQKTAKDLSRESASFVWHQLLIHVLRHMVDDEHAKIDMLKKCVDYYRYNKTEVKNIENFHLTYSSDKVIRWYTSDSFVYKLLNKAFRTENIELIYAFRYFIIDLCAELERRSLKLKEDETLILYRGQQIPNAQFDQLQKNVGKMISPNGFLSTSRYNKVAESFVGKNSDEMTAVLFEIEVNSSSPSIILADIETMSSFEQEHEVLFSVGSTFKIKAIEFSQKLNVWIMRLTTTDASGRVAEYLKLAEDEMKDTSPMIYFGSLLLNELGRIDHANKYFNFLLKTLPSDHPDIAGLHSGLGHIHLKRGEYHLALAKYHKAYAIRRERLSILNPRIAASLRNIGGVYKAMGDNDQALRYFRDAIKIYRRNYSNDHVHIAMIFEDIGLNYQDKNDFTAALHWLEDALEIFKRVLPSEHPQISHCLGRIGDVYKCMGQYDFALKYLHQELEMDEACLPLDHFDIINDLTRLVEIYKTTLAYDQGIQFCQEKLVVYQELLNENHPRIINTFLNIVSLLLKKHELDSALKVCLDAYSIVITIIPMDVDNTIECLQYISDIYEKKEDFKESLKYRQRQVEIEKAIYSPNHSKVGWSLMCIGDIYNSMGQYTASLDILEEAMDIYLSISPRDQDIIDEIQQKITTVKMKQSSTRELDDSNLPMRKSRSRSPSRSRSRAMSAPASRSKSESRPI